MKPAALVKVAAQCAELYREAEKQMRRDTLRGLFDKVSITMSAYFLACFLLMLDRKRACMKSVFVVAHTEIETLVSFAYFRIMYHLAIVRHVQSVITSFH